MFTLGPERSCCLACRITQAESWINMQLVKGELCLPHQMIMLSALCPLCYSVKDFSGSVQSSATLNQHAKCWQMIDFLHPPLVICAQQLCCHLKGSVWQVVRLTLERRSSPMSWFMQGKLPAVFSPRPGTGHPRIFDPMPALIANRSRSTVGCSRRPAGVSAAFWNIIRSLNRNPEFKKRKEGCTYAYYYVTPWKSVIAPSLWMP